MATIRAFETTSFGPEMVNIMGKVFEEAWATMEPAFAACHAGEIESARATLAQRIVWLAQRGHRDPQELKQMSVHTLTVSIPENIRWQ
jgi:hypothetical protein